MNRRSHGRPNRRPPWWRIYPQAYKELSEALDGQSLLRLTEENGEIVIRGRFQVLVDGRVLDGYTVLIMLPANYPRGLPTVFETGGRIPPIPDRHVNPRDGSACLYVPEEWLARRRDDTFGTFLSVPVHNYFLGQLYYEVHRRFPPTGVREHYEAGMIDAYADVLGVKANLRTLQRWLRPIAAKRSKGHWLCPCGSETIVRRCCRGIIQSKRDLLCSRLASRMLRNVELEIARRRVGGNRSSRT